MEGALLHANTRRNSPGLSKKKGRSSPAKSSSQGSFVIRLVKADHLFVTKSWDWSWRYCAISAFETERFHMSVCVRLEFSTGAICLCRKRSQPLKAATFKDLDLAPVNQFTCNCNILCACEEYCNGRCSSPCKYPAQLSWSEKEKGQVLPSKK